MANEIYGLITLKGESIPLTGVEVEGDITGRLGKVTVRQCFYNAESQPLEAVYKFPLPEGSAVCGFKAVIDEKVIQGEIEERDKAFEKYDDAITSGDGAYLLDEERPNIFTVSLGNLNPGKSATIELSYLILLDSEGTENRFFLPTTISPRYLPLDTKDEKGIPAEALVNPPVSLDVPYGMKIRLRIQDSDNIQRIESPSHKISTTFEVNTVLVELVSESTHMDHDFILNIISKKEAPTRGYWCEKNDEVFVQVDFSPELALAPERNTVDNGEIVFLLDCSGSMGGSSIDGAKRVLDILLKAIDKGWWFNIYKFGSSFDRLFDTSREYNPETLQEALKYLADTQADMGGTEILKPMQAIQSSLDQSREACIILLTDGQVGNEAAVMELVSSSGALMKVYPVGIGDGPNEYFIKQLARASGGAAEFVTADERIEAKVLRLFSKIFQASQIRDFKIDWGVGAVATDIPDCVYRGETLSVFAKMDDLHAVPEQVTLSGVVDGSKQEWVVGLREIQTAGTSIPLMWAREKIRQYEKPGEVKFGSKQNERTAEMARQALIQLSKKYGIISSETSFVAIERREENEKTTDEVVLRKVPVMLTRGWGGIEKGTRRFDSHNTNTLFRSVKPEDELEVPSFLRKPLFNRQRSMVASPSSLKKTTKAETSAQTTLLDILALQQPEGGFVINQAVAKEMKSSLVEVKAFADTIKVKGAVDRFVLLSTALVLRYLERQYESDKDAWEAVVQKSQRWLDEQVRDAKPKLSGKALLEWVDDFLQKSQKARTGRLSPIKKIFNL